MYPFLVIISPINVLTETYSYFPLFIKLSNSGDGNDVNVFYKECSQGLQTSNEDPKTLLLLHGAAFTSKTWVESIPTIQTMCALGYRVVAIDLPGNSQWINMIVLGHSFIL